MACTVQQITAISQRFAFTITRKRTAARRGKSEQRGLFNSGQIPVIQQLGDHRSQPAARVTAPNVDDVGACNLSLRQGGHRFACKTPVYEMVLETYQYNGRVSSYRAAARPTQTS